MADARPVYPWFMPQPAPRPNPWQEVLSTVLATARSIYQMKQQKEQLDAAREDRKLKGEWHKLQARNYDLANKASMFRAAQGSPGQPFTLPPAEYPVPGLETNRITFGNGQTLDLASLLGGSQTPAPLPGGTTSAVGALPGPDLTQFLQDGVMSGMFPSQPRLALPGTRPVYTSQPYGPSRTLELPHAPIDFGGGVSVRPETAQQLQERTLREAGQRVNVEREARQVEVPDALRGPLGAALGGEIPSRLDPSVLQAATQLLTSVPSTPDGERKRAIAFRAKAEKLGKPVEALTGREMMDAIVEFSQATGEVRPTEGTEDRTLAYQAHAARLGKSVADLTPQERVAAQGAFRQQTTPPDPSLAAARSVQADDVRFRQANTLRDDFQREAGRFQQIQTTIGQARQLAADRTATSDHALIFNFIRALDEVPSVVRKEEYEAAGNLGSLKQRVEGQIARVSKGDLMAEGIRQQIVRTLDIVERGVSAARNRAITKYRGIATRNKIDPRDVIGEDAIGAASGASGGGAVAHGPAVAKRRLSDGRTEYRDASGATWIE